jgi:hypothetical protein
VPPAPVGPLLGACRRAVSAGGSRLQGHHGHQLAGHTIDTNRGARDGRSPRAGASSAADAEMAGATRLVTERAHWRGIAVVDCREDNGDYRAGHIGAGDCHPCRGLRNACDWDPPSPDVPAGRRGSNRGRIDVHHMGGADVVVLAAP